MNDRIKQYREGMTARILKALEEGTAPWQKPWTGEAYPINAVSGRRYNGINSLLLALIGFEMDQGTDPRWGTFKQAEKKGWRIKKGSQGVKIIFSENLTTPITDDDGAQVINEDGKPKVKNFRYVKFFTVFHASQIEGIDEYAPPDFDAVEANEKAERILHDSGADIRHGGYEAFYNKRDDFIQLPCKEHFNDTESYYSTALHELTHWSGASSRLSRDLSGSIGTEGYAREELVAEISSMFISGETGIPQTEEHFKNHAAYIAGWISLLSSDNNALFKAVSDANKVAEYLLKYEREREKNNESSSDDMSSGEESHEED